MDGEVVALDGDGRPSFNVLQKGGATIVYYIFDVLMLAGRDLMSEPLASCCINRFYRGWATPSVNRRCSKPASRT